MGVLGVIVLGVIAKRDKVSDAECTRVSFSLPQCVDPLICGNDDFPAEMLQPVHLGSPKTHPLKTLLTIFGIASLLGAAVVSLNMLSLSRQSW